MNNELKQITYSFVITKCGNMLNVWNTDSFYSIVAFICFITFACGPHLAAVSTLDSVVRKYSWWAWGTIEDTRMDPGLYCANQTHYPLYYCSNPICNCLF